jgi:hypothetical protein
VNDEAIELLKRIAKDIADIKAAMAAGVGASAAALGVSLAGASGGAGGVATAAEMDGQYGDIEIRKDPPRWHGESFAGCKFSETTPEYLDCYADFQDWRAQKDDASGAKDSKGRPKSGWAIKDARLARGWAARLRAGWKPAKQTNGSPTGGGSFSDDDYDASDDVPFIANATLYGRRDRP